MTVQPCDSPQHAAAAAGTASQQQTAEQVTADTFKRIFRRHPAGVSVITLNNADNQPAGFTATSVISVGPSFLIILDVLQTQIRSDDLPLVYHDRAHHTLRSTP